MNSPVEGLWKPVSSRVERKRGVVGAWLGWCGRGVAVGWCGSVSDEERW